MKASAVWGYVTAMLGAADAAGSGASSSGGGAGSTGAEPGEWQAENQGGWSSMTADMYQAQITGRHGMCYRVKGVRFDGWDAVRRVLLGAKDNYSFLVKENGSWQSWFEAEKYWGQLARREADAAGQLPVEWHFSQKEVAGAVRAIVGSRVSVVYTPRGF